MNATLTTRRKQTTAPDLDALRRDGQARLVLLREQQTRIAPEALVDDRVAQEERDIASQITAVEAELRRLDQAESEIGRREAEALAAEEAKAAEAEQRRQERLEADRLKQAKVVDAACAKFAETLSAYLAICGELGGHDPTLASRLQGVIAHHLSGAGVSRGAVDLGLLGRTVGPLASSEEE